MLRYAGFGTRFQVSWPAAVAVRLRTGITAAACQSDTHMNTINHYECYYEYGDSDGGAVINELSRDCRVGL